MSLLRVSLIGAAVSAATLDLGIGINLGNVLEAPVEGAWAPVAQQYYFDDYATAGFKTVRIPVRWDNHTGTTAPFAINATFMARVQEIVGWSLSKGFNTIINVHHDDWFDVNGAAFSDGIPRFTAIWSQIATTFASASPLLIFECFNEPHVMSPTNLTSMFQIFYETVRPSNPTRWLMFGGLQWDSPSWVLNNPDAVVIPQLGVDPALALQIHDYDPFTFTTPPIGMTQWGSQADINAVMWTMGNMSAWAQAHNNIPIFLGEFGCSVQQTNTNARILWYSTFTAAVKAQGSAFLGLSIWDDDGWFQTYNRGARTWDQAVLTAIGL